MTPILNLYESPILREATGPVIRPGGFDLTDRGLGLCKLKQGARVLDVGCGTGAGVARLWRRHGLRATGLDLSAALLKEGSQTHGGLPLIRGRAEQIPAADNRFGAVLCECVLSLCPHPQRVLGEMRRVLQPGGRLVLTDVYARIAGDSEWQGRVSVRCCLQGAVDRPTVEKRMTAAGFMLELWEDHTALLKQLAARLIWTYGSLDAFWSAAGGACAGGGKDKDGAAVAGHPGYYMVVARKPT